MPEEFEIETPASAEGERLDRFLAAALTDFSRSRLQALIKEGCVTLNGAVAKPKSPLSEGDHIRLAVPDAQPSEALPQDIPLDILHEDDDLLVLCKPHGLVVHPAAGNPDGTLVNALLYHCGTLSTVGGVMRPGIVHRLDKDTSGCMAVAKNDLAHRALAGQFSNRETTKIYLAVVQGRPPMDAGRVENRIARNPRDRQKMAVVFPPAGKEAITDYRVVLPREDASLVECTLHTGRTHQIRVHMKEIGHPILGDPIYANPSRQNVEVPRLMLHAWRLAFRHPATGESLRFEAPIPEAFAPWTADPGRE